MTFWDSMSCFYVFILLLYQFWQWKVSLFLFISFKILFWFLDLTHPLLSWNTDIDGSDLCVLTSSVTDNWITINYVKVTYGCLAHPVISIVRCISIFSVASSFISYCIRRILATWPIGRLPDLTYGDRSFSSVKFYFLLHSSYSGNVTEWQVAWLDIRRRQFKSRSLY